VVTLMVALFWASLGALLYTYLLFPLLVGLRGILLRRPYRSAAIHPRVSLLIAARNEEAAIGAKLDNLNTLEYPADCLQIIIASDGSEDATEEIVGAHRGRAVELLRRPRQGKAAALNAASEAATGEILVFSDANSRWAPDALASLVRPFADERVGGVAGNQVYDHRPGDESAHGERTYWGLDRLLKAAESRAGNTISATGAIYAIRRDLFRPVPADVTDDFFTSAGVIAQGYRLVFAPDAVAYEPPAASGRLEFRRKVRVMTRGLRAVVALRDLLNPTRHGFYALQLLSHKVLRRLMGVPLLLLAIASAALWRRGAFYGVAAAGQAGFYACALAGLLPWPGSRQRLFAVPAFFCLATAASLLASWNVLRGRQIDRWEPARPERGGAP
jgi:cellulose synthase/poly-beta-1,6-N-acetylglucosamine synthase-like glycosyltransferase